MIVPAIALTGLLLGAAAQQPGAPTKPWENDVFPADALYGHLAQGPFGEPFSVFFDPLADELYVADSDTGLVGIFDRNGTPLFTFGGPALLSSPTLLRVTADGSIYVLDGTGHQLKRFDYRGRPLRAVSFPYTAANGDQAGVVRIGTFAVGADGRWYVGDVERPQVRVYDAALELEFVIPRPDGVGSFENVSGIALSAEGLIAVVDARGIPVQVFDREGHFVSGFGSRDLGLEGFVAPVSVAFDERGLLYVVDMLRHDVKVFDLNGELQGLFGGWFGPGSHGRAPGELRYPTDIAIEPGGRVWVAERFGQRVQAFELLPYREDADAAPPRPREGG